MAAKLLIGNKNYAMPVPEFNDNELWIIDTTLKERYGSSRTIELEPAESEIRIHSADRELTLCPILYWQVDKCNFVIFRTGEKRYRCQFFYKVHQQFSTGIEEYDDLTECIITLLQVQADHERTHKQSHET